MLSVGTMLMMAAKKVLFFGSDEFAAIPLQNLIDLHLQPSSQLIETLHVVAPPHPERSRRNKLSATRHAAESRGIHVIDPPTCAEQWHDFAEV